MDGQQYIDELHSLNHYPGISGKWCHGESGLDGCYIIHVAWDSGYSLYQVADAIVDKFQELGLSCLKLLDGTLDKKVLEKGQRYSDLLDEA